MNYLKFTQYAYLLAGILFGIHSITNWNSETDKPIITAIFSVICIFMFFFRRNFGKKFEDRNKKS